MSLRIPRLAFDAPALSAEAMAEVCVASTKGERVDHDASEEPSLLGQIRQRLCSDEELAGQLKSGDADSLTELFRRHAPLMFAISRRILGNATEAEDAVQQVFLDAYRSIGQFDEEKGCFKTWLLLFAYHRTFNLRRGLCASPLFDCDLLDESGLESESGPRSRFGVAERRVLVEQGLSSLEPRQRRTIELVYFGGLTAEEVSNRTGETVRVVRHNLYRGLEKLRKMLCGPGRGTAAAAKGGPR